MVKYNLACIQYFFIFHLEDIHIIGQMFGSTTKHFSLPFSRTSHCFLCIREIFIVILYLEGQQKENNSIPFISGQNMKQMTANIVSQLLL